MRVRYCPPLSKAPEKWKQGTKGRWTCLNCHRTGLLVRHRHRSWPPPVEIPVYGERRGSRNEIVAYALVSPIDAPLDQYLWRITVDGYVYRQSRIGGRQPGGKAVNLYIHREILGLKPGDKNEGHHKDDNPLNNQRWNLEEVTRSENEKYKYGRNVRDGRLPAAPPTPAVDHSSPQERDALLKAIDAQANGRGYAFEDDIIAHVDLTAERARQGLYDLLLQNRVYAKAGKGTYALLR